MKPLHVFLSPLGALALLLVVPGAPASAAPKTHRAPSKRSKVTRGAAQRGKVKRGNVRSAKAQRAKFARKKGQRLPKAVKVLNGAVQVDPVGKEFVSWLDRLEFEIAADELRARWTDLDRSAEFAKWEIHEVVNRKKVFVASGDLGSGASAGGEKRFRIHPAAVMPKFNDGPKDRVYELVVFSGDEKGDLRPSLSTKLIHKRRGSTAPPPEDPFACSPKASHARSVALTAPAVVVHNTSSTPGDNNGQDELEFRVARWGPGDKNMTYRLPGGDLGYALDEGGTIDVFTWHEDDGRSVPTPTFLMENLEHGESVAVSVVAIERDNVHVKKIKEFVILGNEIVATVAPLFGGWGEVVGKAAKGVVEANKLLAPDTDRHDYVGQFNVVFENRCGRIKAAWYTLGPAELDGELVLNGFVDPAVRPETSDFDARTVSMYKSRDDNSNFSPSGWDFGDWRPVGPDDPVLWVTQGTSGLQYSFVLLAQTNFSTNAPRTSRRRGG